MSEESYKKRQQEGRAEGLRRLLDMDINYRKNSEGADNVVHLRTLLTVLDVANTEEYRKLLRDRMHAILCDSPAMNTRPGQYACGAASWKMPWRSLAFHARLLQLTWAIDYEPSANQEAHQQELRKKILAYIWEEEHRLHDEIHRLDLANRELAEQKIALELEIILAGGGKPYDITEKRRKTAHHKIDERFSFVARNGYHSHHAWFQPRSRLRHRLKKLNISELWQVCNLPFSPPRSVFDRKMVDEVRRNLFELDLSLGMTIEPPPKE